MKFGEFTRRYRWFLLAALLVYVGASVWLFRATDDDQNAPFIYLVF